MEDSMKIDLKDIACLIVGRFVCLRIRSAGLLF